MLAFAARTRLLLWPAALALLALVITSVGTSPVGWPATLAWWVTFSLGLPFVIAAEAWRVGWAPLAGPGSFPSPFLSDSCPTWRRICWSAAWPDAAPFGPQGPDRRR